MRFYIPEWDDLVDPRYNFVDESNSKSHDPLKRKNVYMWEIFDESSVPFDGVLVSLMTIIGNGVKCNEIKELGGLHRYLRLPESYPILADCGAWGYIEKEDPLFGATEIFEYYRELGVQEVVTVDHLVLPRVKVKGKMVPVDVQKRMDVTFRNGIEGYGYWSENHRDDFDLLVSVQGLEPSDYVRMFSRYLEHGVTSFAFGGLAKKSTKTIVEMIESLNSFLEEESPDVDRIHFFGLGRSSLFPYFQEVERHGVEVSFDTSSWLRQAWLGGSYFLVEEGKLKKYSALRVPFTESRRSSFKGKRRLTESADKERLGRLERDTMKLLRAFDEEHSLLDDALSALYEYDKWVLHELKNAYRENYEEGSEDRISRLENLYSKLEEGYSRTLKSRPWKRCDCPICQDHGIEVAIFRGNDRNRRRGFHNTYIMYQKVMKNPETWEKIKKKQEKHKFIDDVDELARLEGDVLIITGCTKSKISYNKNTRVKAKNLYTGRLFQAVKLFSKIKAFPYVIISAKYDLIYPDDVIGGYEQVLSSKKDVEHIKPEVIRKLSRILPNYSTILVIAGKRYREVLEDVWDNRFVYVKARGYALLRKKIVEAITKISVPSLKFYIQ